MPQVVNGCGTWYYGKNRVHRIPMTCPNCGAYADLESYDATKYIVFLFVPLIPVSKWRVLEKCPSCTQHRAIKLKDWETAKQSDSAAVTEELREDPTNPETVQKVIGVATAYQDENLFLQVAEKLARPMTGHADVQATLGTAYAYFARRDQAEAAYKASLAVKDDPQVREQLALQLLRQGRPEEAEEHLQHAVTSTDSDHAGFVHLLGEGYLAEGQTERGIELIDQAATMDPAIKADKHHQKLRKKAEKTLGTGRPIPSPILTASKKPGYEEGGVGANVAAWIGPLVAVLLLAFYLSMAWSGGRSREVFVVNGLDVPYVATVADQQVQLQPRSWKSIDVAEGAIPISAAVGDKPMVDTEVLIETNFFSRPFSSRTFVINPDQAALVTWEKNYYSENPANAPESEWELFTGQPLHEFSGVDYEFEMFPNQIKGSSSGSISKTRVATLRPDEASDTDLMFMLPNVLEDDVYRTYVMSKARFTPDDDKWVLVLQSLMPPEDYLSFLKEGIDQRPIHVHWHRAYQTVMERLHPEHDLQADYKTYLEADPNNPELLYLAGRASTDVDRAIAMYRQGVQANPPSPYAANALAYQYLSEGRFEDAEPLVEQAVASDPESLTFDAIYRTTKLAVGKIDELLARVEEHSDNAIGGLMLSSQTVELLGYKGDAAAARRQIDEYFRKNEAADPQFAEIMKDALLTSLAYTLGDMQTFLDRHAEDAEPGFEVLFVRGDLDEAAATLDESELDSSKAAAFHLAVSLKVREAGNVELAEAQLTQGIERLREGSAEERAFAQALAPTGQSDPERLLRLAVLPEQKRVILAALGVRHQEHQEQYFALARKLNFERDVPWAFLKTFLEE